MEETNVDCCCCCCKLSACASWEGLRLGEREEDVELERLCWLWTEPGPDDLDWAGWSVS